MKNRFALKSPYRKAPRAGFDSTNQRVKGCVAHKCLRKINKVNRGQFFNMSELSRLTLISSSSQSLFLGHDPPVTNAESTALINLTSLLQLQPGISLMCTSNHERYLFQMAPLT